MSLTRLLCIPGKGSVTQFPRNCIFVNSQRKRYRNNPVQDCRYYFFTAAMDKKKRVHLFNCDKTYDLLMVEALLRSVGGKLPFTFTISKHYFSLKNMAEICENTISKLTINFAFFVVHANESRLSINESNVDIGYTKVYRALLEATGKFNVFKIHHIYLVPSHSGSRNLHSSFRSKDIQVSSFGVEVKRSSSITKSLKWSIQQVL